MTLREEAEKLVAGAFLALPCAVAPCLTDDARSISHGPGCPRWHIHTFEEAALSAVLAGMRLVLQGVPHLARRSHATISGEGWITRQPENGHDEKQCKRLGGACRLRDLGEEKR